MVIFDSDDWMYIVFSREGYPIWKFWNPCRIFPETVMHMVSWIGIYFFYPITKNYLFSLTVAFAFAGSLSITAYSSCFFALFKYFFNLSNGKSILLGFLFLLFHFSIFRVSGSGNDYLFGTKDVTCFFYYVIPNLLNSSLVMILITLKKNGGGYTKKEGILFLFAYLAVMSNLFQSIIITAYCLVECIFDIICFARNKSSKRKNINLLLNYIKKEKILFAVVFLWIISLVYEANGLRGEHRTETFELVQSIQYLLSWKKSLNKVSIFLVLGILFITIFSVIKQKSKLDEDKIYIVTVIKLLGCIVIDICFLLLLCSVTGSEYILRSDVIFGPCFFVLLIVMISTTYSLKKIDWLMTIIPIAAYFLVCTATVGERIYKEYNVPNHDPSLCLEISEYMMNKIIEGDQNREDVILHIPDYQSDANWPLSPNLEYRIARALWIHKITYTWVEGDTVIDSAMNEYFKMEPIQ